MSEQKKNSPCTTYPETLAMMCFGGSTEDKLRFLNTSRMSFPFSTWIGWISPPSPFFCLLAGEADDLLGPCGSKLRASLPAFSAMDVRGLRSMGGQVTDLCSYLELRYQIFFQTRNGIF